MAENLIWLDALSQVFQTAPGDLRTYSPLTLAYIGDSVYELVIRTLLVSCGNTPVNQLHHKATQMVKASAQAQMIRKLEPLLTEEERAVYRRGRNAHSPTMAKHATMSDYRHATGFEALIGYLYLGGKETRMLELIRDGLEADGEKGKTENSRPVSSCAESKEEHTDGK